MENVLHSTPEYDPWKDVIVPHDLVEELEELETHIMALDEDKKGWNRDGTVCALGSHLVRPSWVMQEEWALWVELGDLVEGK